MSNHHGDGIKTTHGGIGRIVSKDNLTQASTLAGAAAGAAGAVLVTLPSPWAMIAGQLLIAVGGMAVGHDSNAG